MPIWAGIHLLLKLEWKQILLSLLSQNWLQVISFLGILITIAISYSSLSQQRRNGVRESLEQLDAIKLAGANAKVKPILHKYSRWPKKSAIVKLKVYRPTEIADTSTVHPNFLVLPGYVFSDFDVKPIEDGYLLSIPSSNPVEIRRTTDKLLGQMVDEGRRRASATWIPFEKYQQEYQSSIEGEKPQLQQEILDFLEDSPPRTRAQIREHLAEKKGHDNQLVQIAIRDLFLSKSIEEVSDSNKLQIADCE